MKKIIFGLALYSGVVISAPKESGIPMSVKKQLEISSIKIERNIISALGTHFDGRSFLVDVRVIPETYEKDVIPSFGERVKKEGIEKLPGLPVLPTGFKTNGTDNKVLPEKEVLFRAGPIDVTVLVDSSYSVADFGFIYEMVTMTANLSSSTGDRIIVKKKKFPRAGHSIFMEDNLYNDSTKKANTDSAIIDNTHTKKDSIPLAIWGIIAGLIIALIVLILKKKESPNDNSEKIRADVNSALENLRNDIQHIKSNNDDEITVSEKEKKLKELKSVIIRAFIGSPQKSSTVLSTWIESNRNDGVTNSALLIKNVDPDILNILSNNLSEIDEKMITKEIDTVSGDIDEILKTLKTFSKDIAILSKSEESHSEKDIFSFLNQITDQQLFKLVNGEEEGIQALILAQIPSDKARNLIQRFDKDIQPRIMVAMGKLADIPLSLYKDIADKLSQKALAVSNMKFVASDGVKSILSIIFSLPVSEHDSYLHKMSELDLDLVKKVRRFFVPISEIPTLPENLTRKVLQDIDRDILATSLVQFDDNSRKNLIGVLPQQMQQMLVSSIATKSNETAKVIEESQKTILKAFQQELFAIGGREV